MNWKEFLKPSLKKILLATALIILYSFIDYRLSLLGFGLLGNLYPFLSPTHLARSSFLFGFVFIEYFSHGLFGIWLFGDTLAGKALLILFSSLTVILYYFLGCYIDHKKDFFKNYRVSFFIILFFIFIFLNTVNKNSWVTDSPAIYGIPLTFYQEGCGWCIEPCLNCHPGFRLASFLIDLILWISIYFLMTYLWLKFFKNKIF